MLPEFYLLIIFLWIEKYQNLELRTGSRYWRVKLALSDLPTTVCYLSCLYCDYQMNRAREKGMPNTVTPTLLFPGPPSPRLFRTA